MKSLIYYSYNILYIYIDNEDFLVIAKLSTTTLKDYDILTKIYKFSDRISYFVFTI